MREGVVCSPHPLGPWAWPQIPRWGKGVSPPAAPLRGPEGPGTLPGWGGSEPRMPRCLHWREILCKSPRNGLDHGPLVVATSAQPCRTSAESQAEPTCSAYPSLPHPSRGWFHELLCARDWSTLVHPVLLVVSHVSTCSNDAGRKDH